LKTSEGFVEYAAPQIAGREEPFRSEIREHPRGRPRGLEDLAVELPAGGLSVRDIEGAFKDESRRPRADYPEFATRDPSECGIVHLFIDGIAERIRPGRKRQPVLTARGVTSSGAKVPPHPMAGAKEDAETASAFLQGMRARGFKRSAASSLGRRRRHPQGDHAALPALAASALPGAPQAQPLGQGAGGLLVRVQGPRHGPLSGALTSHRPRLGQGGRHRLRTRTAWCCNLVAMVGAFRGHRTRPSD
jgi:hypothetical protein